VKALVTGGAGFIGSHLTARLVRDGHAVTVVQGDPANIKLTTPEDFAVVEALIKEQEAVSST